MTARRFEGKKAIVLGASAEGGSGWAIATRLAEEGARVAVAARNLSELQRLAARIEGVAIRCDAGIPDDLANLAARINTEFGSVDVAIDAAGWPMSGLIADTTPEDLRLALAVNFCGPFWFIQNIARVMNDGGAIVLISSMAATHVVPGQVAYACAKAATNALVRYAAVELGARRIRVNAIAPALIETPMSAPFRALPGALEAVLREVPLGRAATPGDIAAACTWLAAQECFATGATIPIDGGNHLRRTAFPDELPAAAFESIAKGSN